MKRLARIALAVGFLGVLAFWWVTEPAILSINGAGETAPTDLARGEQVFWASGCASCHAKKGASGDEKLLLGGGHRLETPFGTFVTPNISPDRETGIGAWSTETFYQAMVSGVSPDGKHYYPAFPYTSYNKMTQRDLDALFAYLKTLPVVVRANEPHELALPFQWRRPLGAWKFLFNDQAFATAMDGADAQLMRGQYLVEVLGHCGECHTPRNVIGGLKLADWLAGGPAPEGPGKIPNITPHESGIATWSVGDIVYYLESGFTPDFDSVGGTMTSVQVNMTKLPKEDLEAIAAYLKAVPAIPSE